MTFKSIKSQTVLFMLVSGCLSFMTIAIILAVNHITPFGNQNLLVGDMGAQYSPFFSFFKHAIATENFSTFSFHTGVGENIVPLVAYYLLSPFNVIILLFSTSQVPTAITIILMLKVSAISAAMSFYLVKHFQSFNWMNPIFAVVFGICGYVTANFINIMWLDGLICLPLICYGIDRIKDGHSGSQLFIWFSLCIIVNYYIGYMIGIFTIIYAVNLMLAGHLSDSGVKTRLSRNLPFIKSFSFTLLCSVLTSMVVLLPAGLGMFQTAKTSPGDASAMGAVTHPQFGFEVFSQLGLGGQDYVNRLFHAPAIFSSLAIILLVCVYFVHPKINQQRKVGTAFTLITLFLSMLIEPVNLAWHMFNEPSGSPFRYSFLLSFMLIVTAYEAWLSNPKLIAQRFKFGIPIMIEVLLIIGWLFIKYGSFTPISGYLGLQPNSPKILTGNLVLVLMFAVLVFVAQKRLTKIAFGSLVLFEMGSNFVSTLQSEPFGNQTAYATRYTRESAQLSPPSSPGQQLYRSNVSDPLLTPAFTEHYLGYNDPMLFNFNGLQEYSSTLTESLRQSLKELGLFSKNQRRISTAGTTAISNMLLGVKYTHQENTPPVQNTTYVGMGFPVTANFTALSLKPGDIFSNLENVLQRIKPTTQPYLIKDSILKSTRIQTHQSGAFEFTMRLTPTMSGPVYMDTLDPSFDYSAILVNGHHLETIANTLHKRYLVKLGTFGKGRSLIVKVRSNHAKTMAEMNFRTLNEPQLIGLAQRLKSESFKPTFSNNRLEGNVTRTDTRQQWLYTSIPYDSGWSAKVNGQQVMTRKVLGDFTAIPLSAQHDTISMRYRTPGLLIGCFLSLFGLIGFYANLLFKRLSEVDGRHSEVKKSR
ncbi:YfhO family protein [Lentilactobacillus sunkii]|uniref:Bacterial membrane protein YfhO n=1 Tax=Lentilactobacillus sunkii DSM 19904 TaxID=1423808 RepID=A0A0R1L9D2_9LACO|nr:YfhO family protein [Lentilactobacillus sunkii]KRK89529.1 bacterial membrane protein YfhO [Lentilactobacillus sunkii DSM 19904]